jgi:hypothetical protein
MPALAILALLLTQAQAPNWSVDVGATVLREAWDINDKTETLVGVVAGTDRVVWRDLAVRGEILALRVRQDPDEAWLGGFTLGTRGRWRSGALVDVAVGMSTATAPVPSGGTRFNYLAIVGAGIEHPAGPLTLTVTGRWFHASNNGSEGRARNPDIQSLGAAVSVGWKH